MSALPTTSNSVSIAVRLVARLLILLAIGITHGQLQAGDSVPDLETAVARARTYLAAEHPGDGREIIAARYIPPHGNSAGEGYWLVEFAPYPTDGGPLSARTLSGVLIEFGGAIRERGVRRMVDPVETEQIREHAARLGEMMKGSKKRTSPEPTPSP